MVERRAAVRCTTNCASHAVPLSYGRLSKVHVLLFLPDPRALNYYMHTFLRSLMGFYGLAHNSVYLDVGSETLDLKFCELKL